MRSSQHNECVKSGLEKLCLKLFGLGLVHDIPLIIACCIEIDSEFFAESNPGLIREGHVRNEEVRVDVRERTHQGLCVRFVEIADGDCLGLRSQVCIALGFC